jgi:hypothetical protein
MAEDQITAIRTGPGYLLSTMAGFASCANHVAGHFGLSD